MAVGVSDPVSVGGGTTRHRLIDVAIDLFRRQSVAGTSLQMISDELGLTKSAIYYHFRTRDELLSAIVEPVIARLAELVQTAEAQRGGRAQADSMLVGYAALAVANRHLLPVLTGDPGVVELLKARSDWSSVVRRQAELLAGAEPGVGGQVKAAIVMAGISSAVGVDFDGLDDAALRDELVAAGRRTLNLRAPRHQPAR